MTSVRELYELWAGESELHAALERSLEPRGTEWLFELFASLGPRRGESLVDVGCRDAKHSVRLAREHGLSVVAVDPVPLHLELAREAVAEAGVEVDVVKGQIEALPLADASVDWVWCRDVLPHVDAERGLAECARVLRPGGRVVAYATFATELLEPREAEALVDAMAFVPESLDAGYIERCATQAGLTQLAVHRLAGEWRERMIEDDTWSPRDDLLQLSRLNRRRDELVQRFGAAAVAAYAGGHLWGIYQLIGKLCPTVYVWERRA
jgi:ubiquinone/menaquinone biosynthesis C-methylase UbiE